MPNAKPIQYWQRLRVTEIGKTFVQTVIDLKEILVPDGIDQPEDGFRIRSHDLYGPLPDILIKDTGDRYPVIEKIQRETAKLCAMVRVRDDLAAIFPGCDFLLPMQMETAAAVGLRFNGNTVLAEDRTNWEAYHKLVEEAVRRIL
jgi:hypothetical protein